MVELIAVGIQWLASAGYYYAATALLVATVAYQSNQQRKARRAARDAYNASLKDRSVMIDISADAPRTMVLGRVRCVEGIRRRWASGTHDEVLTLIVSFASHQIDGFESFYFDETELELDGDGYVQTAPYMKGRTETRDSGVFTGATYVIPIFSGIIQASAVHCITSEDLNYTGAADGAPDVVTCLFTLTPGGPFGAHTLVTLFNSRATSRVTWQASVGTATARIRTYLGTDAQNVGAALAAEYPGKISATDKFAGIALAVVDLTYDPDIYPQGIPNITARLRGARVLDPRTDTTAWTQNPALHAYHYARHANGWAVPADEIRTADIIAAANVCGAATVFPMRDAAGVLTNVTLERYRCGIVIDLTGDPRGAMDEIFEAMAGRWGWAGGTWRMRCGTSAAPVFAMDQSWLAQKLGPDGQPEAGSVVRISNGVSRENKVNAVSGRCVDADQRYQVLPFPAVRDAALIAAEGSEYALEVEYQGVSHIAHAQSLARVAIRESQAALRIEANCNLSAYRCELFDVGTLTMPRYGFAPIYAEVTGWSWHPTQGIRLTLAETAAEIYSVDELTGRDPAPNGSLPPPWLVETISGVAVSSGTTELSDGSILVRTRIGWTPAASETIRSGGDIEVQYTQFDSSLANAVWASWTERGSATEAIIPGLRAGRHYVFRVRAVNSTLNVRGDWSVQVAHLTASVSTVGGVDTFRQEGEPTTPDIGDLWLQPSTGIVKRWSGTAWEDYSTYGATALTFTGTIGGKNLLPDGGFERDSNADGLADGWSAVSFSSPTGRVLGTSLVAGLADGGSAQRLEITTLGTGGTDSALRGAFVPINEGVKYTASVYVNAGQTGVKLQIIAYDGALATVGIFDSSAIGTAGAVTRLSISFTAPTGAAQCRPYVRSLTGAGAWLIADNAQLQRGDVLTEWQPNSADVVRKVWRQASDPGSAAADGDDWFDTDDRYRHYVRSNGAWLDVRDSAATNFDARNDRNAAAIVSPVISTAGAAVDHTINADGSADLSLEWTWSGTETDIDGFIVYVRQAAGSGAYTMGTSPAQEQAIYTGPDKRAQILLGCAANLYYTFGVQAYRIVDPDVNAAGVIKSALVQPTRSEEAPYRPSSTVAFAGDVTGTVAGTPAGDVNVWSAIGGSGKPADGATRNVIWRQPTAPTVGVVDGDFWFDTDDGNKAYVRSGGAWVLVRDSAATNFDARNDRNAAAIVSPVISTAGAAVDHTINADGSADLSLEWVWSGAEVDIDGFVVYVRSSSSAAAYTMGTSPAQEKLEYLSREKRAFILLGAAANRYYTFGVQAYRIVDPDVNATGFIKTAIVQPTLTSEAPYRPASAVAFAGDITGTVSGIAAVTVAAAATNFDTRNDRDPSAIVAPVISTGGSAVDHTLNTDGSADISLEWTWSGTNASIDGFEVRVRQSTSSAAYTMGTTVSQEQVFIVPSDKRIAYVYGAAADKFYTFSVQAFRIVDPDIAVSRKVTSTRVQPTLAAEAPYQPATNVALGAGLVSEFTVVELDPVVLGSTYSWGAGSSVTISSSIGLIQQTVPSTGGTITYSGCGEILFSQFNTAGAYVTARLRLQRLDAANTVLETWYRTIRERTLNLGATYTPALAQFSFTDEYAAAAGEVVKYRLALDQVDLLNASFGNVNPTGDIGTGDGPAARFSANLSMKLLKA